MGDTSQVDAQLQMRNLLMSFVLSRAAPGRGRAGLGGRAGAGPKDGRSTGPRGWRPRSHAPTGCCARWQASACSASSRTSRFANTPSSEYLRSVMRQSRCAGLARMHGSSPMWQAWAGLEHSVRSGEPSFTHVHGTLECSSISQPTPNMERRFDEGMVNASRLVNEALVEAYEWGGLGTLVDVAVRGGKLACRDSSGQSPHPRACSSTCRTSSSAVSTIRSKKGVADPVPDGDRKLFRGNSDRSRCLFHETHHSRLGRRGLPNHPAQLSGPRCPDHAKLLVCERVIAPEPRPKPRQRP